MEKKMNKVFLAAALAVIGSLTSLMAAPAARVTVDHSSKEAIVDSWLKAIAYGDGEALLQVLLPEKGQPQDQMSDVENFFKGFPAAQSAEFRKMINAPQWKNIVAEILKEMNPYLVKVNGKWYVDGKKILGQFAKDVKVPPCPERVDHSSPSRLFLSFFLGVYYEKDELVLNVFSPDFQKAFAAQNGGKIPKGFAKAIKQSMPQNLLLASIKCLVEIKINADKDFEKFMKGKKIDIPGMKFVKINGKWYIAPDGR